MPKSMDIDYPLNYVAYAYTIINKTNNETYYFIQLYNTARALYTEIVEKQLAMEMKYKDIDDPLRDHGSLNQHAIFEREIEKLDVKHLLDCLYMHRKRLVKLRDSISRANVIMMKVINDMVLCKKTKEIFNKDIEVFIHWFYRNK